MISKLIFFTFKITLTKILFFYHQNMNTCSFFSQSKKKKKRLKLNFRNIKDTKVYNLKSNRIKIIFQPNFKIAIFSIFFFHFSLFFFNLALAQQI